MKLLFISSTMPPMSSAESVHTALLCRHLAAQTKGIQQMSRDYFSWDKTIEKTISLLTAQEGQTAA